MNLKNLFDMQRVLRDRIRYKKQDRFEKLILALIVECGECANEWRGFKFWSKNQKSRTEENATCTVCDGTGDLNYEMVQEDAEGNGNHEYIDCEVCDCSGVIDVRNPLLEEYVDKLHFILELGIEIADEIGFDVWEYFNGIEVQKKLQVAPTKTITGQFILVANYAAQLNYDDYYCELFAAYLNLGEMLGFTDEQIEQAYYTKNAVNHQRQKQGY
ncbi:dUTPase [Bacillus idriensis]|uniref:dUTPase n=1 Tax=Metabacillus idriensis TaxID=324768 RepID=A0A6I2MCS9_9BACI|nr:dUTP diphosphatase [Metabacillus idriensis]MRX54816.1 dUTPase [Metabacillus idriensis]